MAENYGHHDIMKALLEKGADPNPTTTAGSFGHRSLLHGPLKMDCLIRKQHREMNLQGSGRILKTALSWSPRL